MDSIVILMHLRIYREICMQRDDISLYNIIDRSSCLISAQSVIHAVPVYLDHEWLRQDMSGGCVVGAVNYSVAVIALFTEAYDCDVYDAPGWNRVCSCNSPSPEPTAAPVEYIHNTIYMTNTSLPFNVSLPLEGALSRVMQLSQSDVSNISLTSHTSYIILVLILIPL